MSQPPRSSAAIRSPTLAFTSLATSRSPLPSPPPGYRADDAVFATCRADRSACNVAPACEDSGWSSPVYRPASASSVLSLAPSRRKSWMPRSTSLFSVPTSERGSDEPSAIARNVVPGAPHCARTRSIQPVRTAVDAAPRS